MNILEIVELRDKLKSELAVVEKFLEIAKARNGNGGASVSANGTVTPPPRQHPAQPDIPGIRREYGALAEVVREGIKLCPERYTINDIFQVLQKVGKPLEKLQIATALSRFVRRNEIQLHRKGKGNHPAVYKKPSEADAGKHSAAAAA